jgi:hypothetical protein
MPHTITVLRVPGCVGGAGALAVASRIASLRGDVGVRDVVIEDEETALASGFRGSPTVLIDGRDLEPDTEIPPGSMG